MQTFSKRNKLKKEYSGHNIATKNLRNRLLLLYGLPYSGNEYHFGINNTDWIHEVTFGKDLQMHFGRKVPIEDFRDETKTSYDEVFDFIELYYKRALEDMDFRKREKLYEAIYSAFTNSGSVYEFNKDGQVILKIDEETAEKITEVDNVLEPFQEAQKVYRDCVDGLVTRSKAPKNIVGDIYVVFEEYSTKVTKKKNIDECLKYFREELNFHPTQIEIIKKLIAYRGDVWGPAHAGKGSVPDEINALWYLETMISQIKYIETSIKQTKTS